MLGLVGAYRHMLLLPPLLWFINVAPWQAASDAFDTDRIAVYLGIIGLVIVVSGLAAGIVDRGPLSQIVVFLLLGVVAGPHVFGVVAFRVDSVAVQIVATISLILVLFTDAIKLDIQGLRANWALPTIALGPGAILSIILIALLAVGLLNLSWTVALLLGTILASTDAVLMRDVTRDQRVPPVIRSTLATEAGANDVLVLPLTLVLAVIASGATRGVAEWASFAVGLLILGPIAGVMTALIAIRAMGWLRRRRLVRRDYESLYSLGVAFTAYAAAQSVGGSGFIAAFAAGVTIAAIDVELCDCFLEYGETTAEVAMLLTFVFLGSALIDAAFVALSWTVGIFAFAAILLARPVALLITLAPTRASRGGKALIAWFGTRGLGSILLVILAASLGAPEIEVLFGVTAVVVIASIALHGTSVGPVLAWYGRKVAATTLPEERGESRPGATVGLFVGNPEDITARDDFNASRGPGNALIVGHGSYPVTAGPDGVPRIAPETLAQILSDGAPVTVVDVRRTGGSTERFNIPNLVRLSADDLPVRFARSSPETAIVLGCT